MDARVVWMMEYLDRNLDRPLRASKAAAAVRLSYRHFGRLFRRETGLSFTAWLKASRLRRAEKLLMHTLLSAKEVAACIGTDQSHFCRAFRAIHGLSPGRWRLNALCTKWQNLPMKWQERPMNCS